MSSDQNPAQPKISTKASDLGEPLEVDINTASKNKGTPQTGGLDQKKLDKLASDINETVKQQRESEK